MSLIEVSFNRFHLNIPVRIATILHANEGCVIHLVGSQLLSKYSYHNALSSQIFEGAMHVNVSHIIHDLSFGPKYPGLHNPLDGTERTLHSASGTFKYYIKV